MTSTSEGWLGTRRSRAGRRLVIRSGPLGLLVPAVLAGCASIDWRSGAEVAEALGNDAVVLRVPFVAQGGEDTCGLACLTSLLAYHGSELDAEARRRFAPERVDDGGIAAGELRSYLRGRGYRALLVHGRLDASYPRGLFCLLDRGYPVIVELVIPRPIGDPTHHYGLVTGYVPGREWVLVMDPARDATGAIPYETFEQCWSEADHLMLVAGPPEGQEPAE